MLLGSALAALALAAAPAGTINIQGVPVPQEITVEGTKLVHNGSGVRKKFVAKVYVGSLYLPAPTKSADAILAAEAPWTVRLVFMRGVSRDQMMDAFRDGFRNNSPDARDLGPRLEQVGKALPGEMREGSLLTVSYVPGKGSVVTADGGKEAVVEGKDFADALLRNWLGPKPADDTVKRRMLGG